jgi:hypothetical protein
MKKTDIRLRSVQPTCLLSARHRVTGEWRTVRGEAPIVRMGRSYVSGSLVFAIANAISILEREPGPWEVMSISHPGSILNDLQRQRGGRQRKSHNPEPMMLGKLARKDLIPETGQRRPDERR